MAPILPTLSFLVAFALTTWNCEGTHHKLPPPVHYETLPDGSIIATDPFLRENRETPRIVGGRNITDISQAPFMVLIKMRDSAGYFNSLCAGTIISAEWVLTASHCLRAHDQNDIALIAGNVVNHCVEKVCHADKGAQFPDIDQVFFHPESTYDRYNPNALTEYDIALIKVKPPLKLDGRRVAAVGLPSSDYPITSLEHGAYGWGIIKWEWFKELYQTSSVLQEATIQIRSESDCQRILTDGDQTPRYNPEIHFCAGGLGEKQPCLGDSGGPLVTRGKNRVILGVLNYGRICGEQDQVSVYMNVFKVLPWIKETVGIRRRGQGANRGRKSYHGGGKGHNGGVKWSWGWDANWDD